jgi:competence protein ComEC
MSPLAYCTVCFVIGVLTYPHITPVHAAIPFVLFCMSIICHQKPWHFGFILCLSLLSWIGGQHWAQLQDPLQNPKHIAHQHDLHNKESIIVFSVQDKPKPSAFSQSYVVRVHQIDDAIFSGLALLQLEISSSLSIGENYMTLGMLRPIPKARNPGGFDFANYMKKKEVLLQLHSDSNRLTFIDKTPSLRGYAFSQREQLLQHIDKLGMRKQSEAVLQALVLGDRSELDTHLQEEYAKAGAVHLLAISGLHVGVIMLLLQSFFGYLIPLTYKYRRWFLFATVTLSLWSYAFLTGLSPSVLRAVTMFSFLSFSNVFHRPGLPMQQLWLSLLVLILIRPSLVYEVGFQLSYAAVFGILWVMPKIHFLFQSKWVFFQKGWSLLVLGCIAQLSTLPFSLYYFHQFPGLFWISNLVIVPLLGVILVSGLLGVAIAPWEIGAAIYGKLLDFILYGMNTLVSAVAQQESFLFTDIAFDHLDALLLAAMVFVLFLLIRKFRLDSLALLVLLSFGFHYSVNSSPYADSELVVFHDYQNTLIGIKKNKDVTYLHDISQSVNQRLIDDYTLNRQIRNIVFQNFPLGLQWGEDCLLIVDENELYDFPSLAGCIIVLRNSPKVHLDHLIQHLHPKEIIADGSNYKRYINRWEQSCKSNGIELHDTSTDGAYILNP